MSPFEEAVVSLAVGKAGSPHPYVLQQPEIPHLMDYSLFVKRVRRLVLVGLDTTNVERLLTGEGLDQSNHRVLEQCSSCLWAFGCLKKLFCQISVIAISNFTMAATIYITIGCKKRSRYKPIYFSVEI